MKKTDFVIGAAGTGKTTWIENKIREVEAEGKTWTYITYSAAMAAEAKQRIGRQFDTIGTFHSLISKYQGLHNFFTYTKKEHGVAFAQKMGITYNPYHRITIDEESDKDDFAKFLSAYSLMHNTLADAMPEDTDGILDMEFLRDKYDAFKRKNGLIDYTDILRKGLDNMPFHDVLFVDESQDLTPLLWDIIDGWPVGKCYVVGDPYQSIYTFLGSSIDTFMDHYADANSVISLNKSYRFGDSIKELSKSVVKGVANIPIEYEACGNTHIKHSTYLSEFTRLKGTKAILARTNKIAKKMAEVVEPNLPINYEHAHNTPYDKSTIMLTNIMHRYPDITMDETTVLARLMPASMLNKGVKTDAVKNELTLDDYNKGIFRMAEKKRDIIVNMKILPNKKQVILKNYIYGINMEDVVYIDTIHASKGMEFDNVMLLTDIPYNITQNADEKCILYTGITRVRQNFYYGYMGLGSSSYVVR